MALTKINNNTLSAITGLPAGVGGKVLQVVTGETGTQVTHSTSYADTGLSASITPSSTSNKILILVDQCVYWTTNGLTIRILRDSTSVFEQPVAYTVYDDTVANHRSIYGIQYLDSPSSTSSLTFKTQCKLHTSGTITTQDNSNKSRITLMEIAG
jgi:hypothetical protein